MGRAPLSPSDQGPAQGVIHWKAAGGKASSVLPAGLGGGVGGMEEGMWEGGAPGFPSQGLQGLRPSWAPRDRLTAAAAHGEFCEKEGSFSETTGSLRSLQNVCEIHENMERNTTTTCHSPSQRQPRVCFI